MRTIAHLSDLHFGRTDPNMVKALQGALASLRPDLVLISGDFTQRAKESEFIEARAFLDKLPAPCLAVPGNHDIRLYDLYGRFIRPLSGYGRYISKILEPAYFDAELAVVSINTARSFAFKGGRVNARQVERVRRQLVQAAPDTIKILMAHHPLDLPETIEQPLAGRARMAMEALATSGLDLVLSGHLHSAYFPEAAERLSVGGHNALLVQAGTAVSTRSRGKVNSFNSIKTERDQINLVRHCWSPEANHFEQCIAASYRRSPSGWARKAD
jgi:3',5'-cyclic AMP phosphodiesterase CpdA